jgi:hypothetical protein
MLLYASLLDLSPITPAHRRLFFDWSFMSTIQIKHRHTGAVLFEGESGMTMRQTLEKATASIADLSYANLSYADLSYANLRFANLRYADLSYANLRSADLSYADLRSANLRSADLSYADLRSANLRCADLSYANLIYANLSYANLIYADLSYANLRSADLSGKKLIGNRPFFTIGPIGSRCDYMQAWITDSGVMIRAGCFFGTREKFEIALSAKHGDNEHGQEYRAALVLIDKHTEFWTPKVVAVATKADEVAALAPLDG